MTIQQHPPFPHAPFDRKAPRWLGRILVAITALFLLVYTLPRLLQYLDVMGFVSLPVFLNAFYTNINPLRHHNDGVLFVHLVASGAALTSAVVILARYLARRVDDLTVTSGVLHAAMGALFVLGSIVGVVTAYVLSFSLIGSPFILAEQAWMIVIPYVLGTSIWGGCVVMGTWRLAQGNRVAHLSWMVGAATYMFMFVTHRFGVAAVQWSGVAFQDQSSTDLVVSTYVYAAITYAVLVLHGALALYFAHAIGVRERWRARVLATPAGLEPAT